MASACALAIISGKSIFNFGIAERLRTLRYSLFTEIFLMQKGCRTGFYLLTRGLTPAQALELTVDSFRFMAAFEGDIPGASEVECGNYRDMDLPAAKAEAAAMLPVLEALTADQLHY